MAYGRRKAFVNIAICFGTRPEIIKLCVLSKRLSQDHDVINIFTGQHHSLFNDVKNLIQYIHYNLPLGEHKNINLLYSDLMGHISLCFEKCKPDLVIVQGDTASSYCAAMCAFMNGIRVGHVEAGLRTYNIKSPFPEEFNRQSISKIADYNWCPSTIAMNNLIEEDIDGEIILTGNTIVDFVYRLCDITNLTSNNEIILTLHRRENSDLFKNMLLQINNVANNHKDLRFVFPAHPNPIIQSQLGVLSAPNVEVIKPVPYEYFIKRLSKCKAIITDSGGIQEEAVCLRKKVMVCRNTTERREAINIGLGRLVGDNIESNFDWLIEKDLMVDKSVCNPYGNGDACEKIADNIREIPK